MVIHHQKMKLLFSLFLVNSAKQHSTGFNSHHGSWRQVGDGDQGLADQFFRLVVSVDSGKDGTVCAGSVVQGELEKFLGLLNSLAGFYLNDTEIRLLWGVNQA